MHGIELERAPVGDRYVLRAARGKGWLLGGREFRPRAVPRQAHTGDAIIARSPLLRALVEQR
jgi:phosphoglucosamine mutase